GFLGRSFGNFLDLGRLGSFLGLGGLRGALLGALLGLLAGLTLLGVQLGGALLDAGDIEEAGNAVRRLRADAKPVAGAVPVELDALVVILGEQRVVGPDLLQVLAVARRAAVGHHDAVIRTLLVAPTRKPDCYCHVTSPFR